MTQRGEDLRALAAALPGWRTWARQHGAEMRYCAEREFAGELLELRAPTPERLIAACRDLERRIA